MLRCEACGERFAETEGGGAAPIRCPSCGKTVRAAAPYLAESVPEEYDDDTRFDEDDRPARSQSVPGTVKAAGVIWIVIGALYAVVGVLYVVLLLLMQARNARGDAAGPAMGVICGGGLLALFAVAFFFVGVQSVKGTAKDTLGNGVGSILLGLLAGLIGVVGIAASGDVNYPTVVGQLIFGGSLILAGVLALVGREDYRAWRRVYGPPPARRRPRRDDD